MPVGAESCSGDVWLLLVGFLPKARALFLGKGGTEDRSLETFRIEKFRA